MKPTSRLRMRARSESERLTTGCSLRTYSPSLGVSSKPRIDNSVDLPQPEGPAIKCIRPSGCRDECRKARASRPRRYKKPSLRQRGELGDRLNSFMSPSFFRQTRVLSMCVLSRIRFTSALSFKSFGLSTHPDSAVTVHGRSVRQDHLISFIEPADYFDRVNRT